MTEAQEAFIYGLSMQLPLAFFGILSAFNWSAFLERGDQHGVRTYRRGTMVVMAAMMGQPIFFYFLASAI